ncbi:hypothetical protein PM082_023029 [Marasmius tenuissimus]|nr:hypothetical protein PM082_023029 [Marasmius tenuissimus]
MPEAPKQVCSMGKLPNELLSEIFVLTHASHPRESPFRHPLFPKAQPITLGSVCRHWRFVAHNTKSIWQEFDYFPLDQLPDHILGSDDSDLAGLRERAGTVLERWLKLGCQTSSQTSGLRFSFRMVGSWYYTPLEVDLLRVLVGRSNHWVSFVLEMDMQGRNCYANLEPLGGIRGKIPRLEYLEITLQGNSLARKTPGYLMDAFEYAPRLNHFMSYGFWHAKRDFKLPWGQFGLVVFRDRRRQDSYHVLSLATSASTVSLRTRPMGRVTDVYPELTLPALKTLELGNDRGEGEILSSLNVPNLDCLMLIDHCYGESSVRHAHEMVVRSRCKITALELEGAFFGSCNDILLLLHSCDSSLRELSLDGMLDGPPGQMEELVQTSNILSSLSTILSLRSTDTRLMNLQTLNLYLTIGINSESEGRLWLLYACEVFEAVARRNEVLIAQGKKVLVLNLYVSGLAFSRSELDQLRLSWEELSKCRGAGYLNVGYNG